MKYILHSIVVFILISAAVFVLIKAIYHENSLAVSTEYRIK